MISRKSYTATRQGDGAGASRKQSDAEFQRFDFTLDDVPATLIVELHGEGQYASDYEVHIFEHMRGEEFEVLVTGA